MKNSIYKLSLLVSLLIFTTACGGDGDTEPEEPSAQELTFENLSGQWGLPSTGGIVVDGVDRTLNYQSFNLSFTEGGYTTNNAGDLFDASGTWQWADAETTTEIVLDDGKEISLVELTTTRLVFTFNQSAGGVRAGIAGNYRVTMNK